MNEAAAALLYLLTLILSLFALVGFYEVISHLFQKPRS